MWAGQDFPLASPSESYVYTFDFTKLLVEHETIQSVTWSLENAADTPVEDATPGAHLGAGNTSAGKVTRRVSNLLAGVRYRLVAVITTSNANTYELYAHMQCLAPDQSPIDPNAVSDVQGFLNAIDEAINSGASRVSYDGKSVDYRSLDELKEIRAILLNRLDGTPRRRTFVVTSDRGY
jgi:hypothetical protein